MNLMRIQPDKERAKSLIILSELRLKKVEVYDEHTEASLIIEIYYEIAKELITAILFIDGYKTFSHVDLVDYLKTSYNKDFDEFEIELLDQLRKYRNKIVYYGRFIDSSYLRMNKKNIISIIDKLYALCRNKL